MLAQHFVKWCETANTAERCSGVALLADAVVGRKFLPAEIRQAEAALVFALDDPSPRVRRTIADHVEASDLVPRQLVRALSTDVDEVAIGVVEHSPLLSSDDLVSLVCTGSAVIRRAVARRARLDGRTAQALAESGDADACLELARNPDGDLPVDAVRGLVEAWADHPRIRDALLRRDGLSAPMRHALLLRLGEALCGSPFVQNAAGAERVAQLREDVAEQATASLIELLEPRDLSPFVEHLRSSGQLNTAVLVRAVCCGRIDLFASSLARLTGLPAKRVRAIVAEAREPAFAALASAAGLPCAVVPLLLGAVRVWREMSWSGDLDPSDIAATVMERVVLSHRRAGTGPGFEEIATLLHRLAGETQRLTTRRRAENYLAA